MINLANHQASSDNNSYSMAAYLIYYRFCNFHNPLKLKQRRGALKANDNFGVTQNLLSFKSKSTLCWRSDAAYLNLRGGFLNLIPALHLVWTAVKNNRRIVLVNHGSQHEDKPHLSTMDLMVQTQLKPKVLPRIKLPYRKQQLNATKTTATIADNEFNEVKQNQLNLQINGFEKKK